MPAPPPVTPEMVAALARFLEQPQPDRTGAPSLGLEVQLQAALGWLRGQDKGPLADFIGRLMLRLAQDGLSNRVATQAARLELLTLRAAREAEDGGRLSGAA